MNGNDNDQIIILDSSPLMLSSDPTQIDPSTILIAASNAIKPEIKPSQIPRKRRSKYDANGLPRPKTDLILPREIVELTKDVLQSYCDSTEKRCLLCGEKYDTDRIYSVRRHLFRKHRSNLEEEVVKAQHLQLHGGGGGGDGGDMAVGLQTLQGTLVNYVKSQSAFDLLLINLFSTVPVPISLTENEYFHRLLRMIPSFNPPTSVAFRGQLFADNYRIIGNALNCALLNNYCAVSSGVAFDPYTLTSYLGIILHFYDYTSRSFKNIAVSLAASDKISVAADLEVTILERLWENQISSEKLIKNVMTAQIGLEKELFSIEKSLAEPEEVPILKEDEEDPIIHESYAFDAAMVNDCHLPEITLAPNSLHCISNRLENTMTAAFNSMPELVELKTLIFKILENFSQSPSSHQELKNLTRIKLSFPTSNSWPSVFAAFKRVLYSFDGIHTICDGWIKFDNDSKEKLQNVIDLFEPILKFRKAVQTDTQPTISLVYNGIHGLVEICKANTSYPEFAEALKNELFTRFPDVLDPENFDPVYLAAAALDPRTFELVCKEEATKDALYKVLQYYGFEEHQELSPTANEKEMPASELIFGFDLPSAKKIKIEKKPSRTIAQISSFLNKISEGEFYNCLLDAGQFWNYNKDFPVLGRLAFNLLSIPATAINVEKLFIKLQTFTNSGKASTVDEMYETRAMLAFNNHLNSG
uniref:HAT C-terminal dimerisation domain-containing protein n=1 Tax=Panagrolaimus superbus TaxID=310955 RepID=A0A914YSM9_9BILA